MTKLKTLLAATLITLPVLALDAAQLPVAQGTISAQGTVSVISETRPTTTNDYCCILISWYGMTLCLPC